MNVVVNADDFGISECVNDSIYKLHRLGIITSSSIMPGGECFNNAVLISRECSKLGTGIHISLEAPYCLGNEFTPISKDIFTDIDSIFKFIRNHRILSAIESEILRECSLQIEKVLDHHIQISHIDTHHHFHVYPKLLRILIKLAQKYRIPFIRTQKLVLQENQSFSNYIYRHFHHIYLKHFVKTADAIFEPRITNHGDYETEINKIIKLVSRKKTVIELIVHPGETSDPQTIFLSNQYVIEILKHQNLINFHSLK
jgi:chitin disaccharide deacetylase